MDFWVYLFLLMMQPVMAKVKTKKEGDRKKEEKGIYIVKRMK